VTQGAAPSPVETSSRGVLGTAAATVDTSRHDGVSTRGRQGSPQPTKCVSIRAEDAPEPVLVASPIRAEETQCRRQSTGWRS